MGKQKVAAEPSRVLAEEARFPVAEGERYPALVVEARFPVAEAVEHFPAVAEDDSLAEAEE